MTYEVPLAIGYLICEQSSTKRLHIPIYGIGKNGRDWSVEVAWRSEPDVPAELIWVPTRSEFVRTYPAEPDDIGTPRSRDLGSSAFEPHILEEP